MNSCFNVGIQKRKKTKNAENMEKTLKTDKDRQTDRQRKKDCE